MTFLKTKYNEAKQILLNIRKEHYCFLVSGNVTATEEFAEYFYKNQLQTKEWHISGNNKWKVIDFHFSADVYREAVEVLLYKNYFSDRKVSISYEKQTVNQLKTNKLSLNKLYRSFQYAYHYNYLFCIYFDDTLTDEDFATLLNQVKNLFIKAAIQKTEPLYCLISLTTHQHQLITDYPDVFNGLISSDQNTCQLPELNEEDVLHVLNKHSLFSNANDHIKSGVVHQIMGSDDILLQLKNIDRKLTLGILPVPDEPPGSLKITSQSASKITFTKSENEGEPVTVPDKDPFAATLKTKANTELSETFNLLGTRYQRDNFRKTITTIFQLQPPDTVVARQLSVMNTAKYTKIPGKDIRLCLHPFSQKNYLTLDQDDDQEDIVILKENDFRYWPELRQWLKNKQEMVDCIQAINDSEDWPAEKISQLNLNSEFLDMARSDDGRLWFSQCESSSTYDEFIERIIPVKNTDSPLPDTPLIIDDLPAIDLTPEPISELKTAKSLKIKNFVKKEEKEDTESVSKDMEPATVTLDFNIENNVETGTPSDVKDPNAESSADIPLSIEHDAGVIFEEKFSVPDETAISIPSDLLSETTEISKEPSHDTTELTGLSSVSPDQTLHDLNKELSQNEPLDLRVEIPGNNQEIVPSPEDFSPEIRPENEELIDPQIMDTTLGDKIDNNHENTDSSNPDTPTRTIHISPSTEADEEPAFRRNKLTIKKKGG